ncbi:Peptidyl-glycine alpha-amidating monooxygenase [Tupaia chinensis]|uniref:Peptidyl-glycine alpha-amidating monooxygenase n=1 Tax=Tupaia chinensis TaxID=246437 RepID=L9LDC8_TUPCH|nr:Peptidyl-glycine alpha-amidating monooxygenase [Tupaia chinensis]
MNLKPYNPNRDTTHSDTYFCMSMRLPMDEEAFVKVELVLTRVYHFLVTVDFKPRASMDTVHHMLLFGCNMPSSTGSYWFCDEGTCADKANILYAWARNAPPTRLPKGVGFRVGGETGSKYFVLQVHYGDISAFRDNHKDCSGVSLHLTRLPQPLTAGMYLMMSVDTVIPAGEKGKVVSGYRVRDGQWTLIGRQSPQLPQAFYPVEHPVDVSFGDILAARCVFTGEGRTEATHIGGTSSDEMCNLYIMYYMEAKHAVSFMTCTQNVAADMFRSIPPEANIPIPVKPDMLMMHGHHKETEDKDKTALLRQPKQEEGDVIDEGDFYSLLSKLLGEREDVVRVHKYNPTEKAESESDLVAEIANVVQKKDLGRSDAREGAEREERGSAILVRDRIHKFHRLESTLRPAESKGFSFQQPLPGEGTWEPDHTGDFHVEEVLSWPGMYLLPVQVSGVALDLNNNLVIFHRGDHVWDGNSFDSKFVYQQRGLGPIEEDTILVVDPKTAAVLQSSGKNLWHLAVKSSWLVLLVIERKGHLLAESPQPLYSGNFRNYFCPSCSGTAKASFLERQRATALNTAAMAMASQRMSQGPDSNASPTTVHLNLCLGAVSIIRKCSYSKKELKGKVERRQLNQLGHEFYLPHGLSVDKDGNYWVTDVALHQVFKLDPQGKEGPLLTLGRSMQPGSDQNHFCQPTDVAVDPGTGAIYVSDGYCNSRIVQFSPAGKFVTQWGEGLLFAVNGKPYFGDQQPLMGFVMNFSNGAIMDVFTPMRKDFDMPHDLVASEDGSVFVGDIHAYTVWKFSSTEKMMHRSVKKAGIEVQDNKEAEAVVETKMENKPTSELQKMQEKQKLIQDPGSGVPVVLITTLLVIPGAVLLAIAIFIRWKKSRAFGGKRAIFFFLPADSEHKLEASSGRVLGRFRGKGSRGLNLGNFFASRKGYSRKGFDRLSTEGSDHEKDEDDGSESEEEYSAPLPTPAPSSS